MAGRKQKRALAEHAHFVKSPWLVPFDAKFDVKKARTSPPKGAPGKQDCRKKLDDLVEEIRDLQEVFYASDRHALLLVFQAMDAAGKDGTIRAVLTGTNPAACQVYSFKAPSDEELDHDFLWRTARSLPERGRIGVFNRSYYEEVLVVRAHPQYLERQRLPKTKDLDALWQERFESIRDHERHLARNGTVVVKFWLNVSRAEQKKRFLSRIDERTSNWKFQSGDVAERAFWPSYMKAYEEALNATSRPWAPWYAIPADDKAYMRVAVAQIVVDTLRGLPLAFPELDGKEQHRLREMRRMLTDE